MKKKRMKTVSISTETMFTLQPEVHQELFANHTHSVILGPLIDVRSIKQQCDLCSALLASTSCFSLNSLHAQQIRWHSAFSNLREVA
jgi:hypothetical protein